MIQALRTYKYYFIGFLIIGCIVYFPMCFNGFVWDDIGWIVNNSQLQQFNLSIFFDNDFNNGTLYRQFMPFYISFMYTLFGLHAFPYHFVQLLLHILATSLLFLLFTKYFRKGLSFILCLFFLVHPINAEAVLWISSIQTQAFIIPGLSALLILHKKKLRERDILFICLLLFFSLISYEAGLLFFPLVLLYLFLHKSPKIRHFLYIFIGLAFLYFILRYIGHGISIRLLQDNPIAPANFSEKIFTMPSIIMYYFKTLLFPLHLMVWQYWKVTTMTFSGVILPTLFSIFGILLLINFIGSVKSDKKNGVIFFSVWLFIGLMTLLQIFPLDMTVSDRWFYFPFIGLLGILGHIYERYAMQLKRYKPLLLILSLLLCTVYGIRTFYRSFDWQNNKVFYSHELILQPDNIGLNYNLGAVYILEHNYKKAIYYLEKVEKISPKYKDTLTSLGAAHFRMGDYNKALYYFHKALQMNTYKRPSNSLDIYNAIALSYGNTGRYEEIDRLITEKVIRESSDPYGLLYLRAEARFKLKKYQEAYNDIEYMYHTTLDPEVDKLYKQIEQNLK